jgi:hypothetical protein
MQKLHLLCFAFALNLCALAVHADEQPTTQSADLPAVKEVRDKIVEWDKTYPTMSLEDVRKTFHTENDREAKYYDWMAHETWEGSKTEKAVRDKWGSDADAKYMHPQGGSTIEDDQVCTIKVDGDHAVASWKIENSQPLSMIKIDGHWLVDGHTMFEQGIKDNPNMDENTPSTARLMKKAREDIEAGKFDDADSFIADFQKNAGTPPGGN